jgi:hypothetical protein
MLRRALVVSLLASGCIQDGSVTVTISGDGSGLVTSDPAGLVCGGAQTACTMVVDGAGVAKLTAIPTEGAAFIYWGGACAGTGDCFVDGSSDATVDARFERYRTLTIETSGSGVYAVTAPGTQVNCSAGTCVYVFPPRTEVTLIAATDDRSAFIGWIDACSETATYPQCSIVLDRDVTVGARFAPLVQLSIAMTGTGTGRVSTSPSFHSCTASCDILVPAGTALTLHGQGESQSTFTGWTGGGCVSTYDCTVLVTSTVVVGANFEAPP